MAPKAPALTGLRSTSRTETDETRDAVHGASGRPARAWGRGQGRGGPPAAAVVTHVMASTRDSARSTLEGPGTTLAVVSDNCDLHSYVK